MKVKRESEVAQLCPTLATPWTAAHQAPPSMGFSRQEYWSGVPLPSTMVLAQTQKYRSLEQNRKPRDKCTHLWTPCLKDVCAVDMTPASPRFTVPSAPWAAASGSRGVLVQPRGESEVGVDPGGEKLTRRRALDTPQAPPADSAEGPGVRGAAPPCILTGTW